MNAKPPLVYLVGGGPGDPGLITLRGIECLSRADVVIYDRLIHPSLLAYAPTAEKIDVGKRAHHHPVPQAEINALLLQKAVEGKIVVRLKGGDPFLFGRGGEEVLALKGAGVPFEIVPGVTSGVAVPAYAGIPVTQRGFATSVVFLTAHRQEGCPPDQICIPSGADTYVFFMGVERLPIIVAALLAQGKAAETPVAVIEQGTTPSQKTVIGCLGDILSLTGAVRPPAVIVVGEVVRLHEDLNWFESPQRPLLGLRVLNTRPVQSGLNRVPRREDAFQKELLDSGADAVEFPVTRVIPVRDPSGLDAAIAMLNTFDELLFTSVHAVDYFLDRVLELEFDLRILGGIKIAALGKSTTGRLNAYHLKADFVPESTHGKSLGEELPEADGKSILFPCSNLALEDALQSLINRGARVEAVIAYEVVPADPAPASLEALLGGEIDVISFFSPSAVDGLLRALPVNETITEDIGLAGKDVLAIPVICIGETTARAARAAGFDVQAVAREQTSAGVIQTLIEWRRKN